MSMAQKRVEELFHPILDSAPTDEQRYWRLHCFRVARLYCFIDQLESSDPELVQAAKDGIARISTDPEAIW